MIDDESDKNKENKRFKVYPYIKLKKINHKV